MQATINTERGPLSPEDALRAFQAGGFSKGGMVGVFNQLASHPEGWEAARFVKTRGDQFPEKLHKKAKEILATPPLAPREYWPAKGQFAVLMFNDISQQVEVSEKEFNSAEDAAKRGRQLEAQCLIHIPFVIDDTGHFVKVSGATDAHL